MSKEEEDDIDLPAEETDEVSELPTPKPVLNKNGKPKRVMTREMLERLAVGRQKALEVRRSNAVSSGRSTERDAAKAKAKANKDFVNEQFNNRVKIEVEKRLEELKLDKINNSINENMQKMFNKKKKEKKQVIYETDDTDTDTEVVQIVKKKTAPPREPEQQPAPPPPPPPRQPKPPPTPQELADHKKKQLIQHLLNRPPF